MTNATSKRAHRRDAIREACDRHGWSFLEPGHQADLSRDRVVIGLAMWSNYDFDFVKNLDRSSALDSFSLALFDIDDVRNESDLRRFIPFAELPTQTPVLGVIRDGRLLQQMQGRAVLAMSAGDIATLSR